MTLEEHNAMKVSAESWEHLRVPYEGDTATVGELTLATEHPDGTCAVCDTANR